MVNATSISLPWPIVLTGGSFSAVLIISRCIERLDVGFRGDIAMKSRRPRLIIYIEEHISGQ